MALSANSLIHYTAKIENLLGILSSKGLRYSYCEERIKTRGGKNFSAAIAMVSFCDIPLSDYKKHFYNRKNTKDLGYYGDYGIGISKKWANKRGLNSVFYVEYNSFVGTAIRKDYEDFISGDRVVNKNLAPQIFLYCKNYQAGLYRKEVLVKQDYRFYDEREWRIVPDNEALGGVSPIIETAIYRADKERYQARIANKILPFDLEDISYIIVREESEVKRVYQEMEAIFRREMLELASIRVLTSEQILSDF